MSLTVMSKPQYVRVPHHPVTESYRGWQPSLLNSLHRFGRAMGETSSCNYAQAQRGTLGVLELVQHQRSKGLATDGQWA